MYHLLDMLSWRKQLVRPDALIAWRLALFILSTTFSCKAQNHKLLQQHHLEDPMLVLIRHGANSVSVDDHKERFSLIPQVQN